MSFRGLVTLGSLESNWPSRHPGLGFPTVQPAWGQYSPLPIEHRWKYMQEGHVGIWRCRLFQPGSNQCYWHPMVQVTSNASTHISGLGSLTVLIPSSRESPRLVKISSQSVWTKLAISPQVLKIAIPQRVPLTRCGTSSIADIDSLSSFTPHHSLFFLSYPSLLLQVAQGAHCPSSECFLRSSFKTGFHCAFQAILELTL